MMLMSLDSGDPLEIEQVRTWRFTLDKITSNPTTISGTMKRDGGTVYDVAMRIRDAVGPEAPVSIETLGTPDYNPGNMNPEYFAKEAREIDSWGKNFVIKLPSVKEGFEAARLLAGEVAINFTLVFSTHQGHMTGVYGGTYTSPFVGRYDDKLKAKGITGREGMDIVKEILNDFRICGISTHVLTASTRNRRHIEKAAEYGSHVVTIPFNLFKQLYNENGNEAAEWLMKLRENTQSYTPSRSRRPAYDEGFDYSLLLPHERELLQEGLARFLNDAKMVGYRII